MTKDDPRFKAGAVFGRMTRTVNRAGWAKGPWDDEPDLEQWTHVGLPCAAVRNDVGGVWCGYVGVPVGHPLFGKDYDYNAVPLDVHGGLTFCSETQGDGGLNAGLVANTVNGEEAQRYWWYGFDCSHYQDKAPGMQAIMAMQGMRDIDSYQVYRTLEYVRKEVNSLAEQLDALKQG